MGKRVNHKAFKKTWVISDIHASRAMSDLRAFNTFLAAYAENEADALIINGDLLDLSVMMGDKNSKLDPSLPQEDMLEEIDYCIDNILKPLHKVKKGKVPILFKPGNHDLRVMDRIVDGQGPLRQLVRAARQRGSIELEDLLRFDEFNIDMSMGEDGTGIDVIRKLGSRAVVLHGTLTNAARLKSYLRDVFPCSSGTSGHTHKGEEAEINTYFGSFRWVESGCLCRIKNVPYLPQGKTAGWRHKFVTIWQNKNNGETHIKGHPFQDYSLEFHGQAFSA